MVWSHSQVVRFNSERGGISVITAKGHTTTSHLLIQGASSADSGDYVCRPNNADPAAVTVHILDGRWCIDTVDLADVSCRCMRYNQCILFVRTFLHIRNTAGQEKRDILPIFVVFTDLKD